MTVIKVKCVDQTLVFASTPLVASGGINEDFMQFTFCSKWDDLEKTAVFWRSEADVYHVLLDEENSVQVPPEVTADAGVIYFGVFGVNVEGKQRTSEVLTYTIEQGTITTGTKPSDPTPDIYTQLLAKYGEMRDIAAETRAAEAAFEQKMTQDQAAFEQEVAADHEEHRQEVAQAQQAFEQQMTQDQAEYEAHIEQMIKDGLLPDNSVTTVKLQDKIVTTAKLADGAVTKEKMADNAVDTAQLANGAVTKEKIAEGAVTPEMAGARPDTWLPTPAEIGGAQIVAGSYTGTGTGGSANPNTLTFSFVPKIVMVYTSVVDNSYGGHNGLTPQAGYWASYSFIWSYGQTNIKVWRSDNAYYIVSSVNGNTFSWYAANSDSYVQCNKADMVFNYVAIG